MAQCTAETTGILGDQVFFCVRDTGHIGEHRTDGGMTWRVVGGETDSPRARVRLFAESQAETYRRTGRPDEAADYDAIAAELTGPSDLATATRLLADDFAEAGYVELPDWLRALADITEGKFPCGHELGAEEPAVPIDGREVDRAPELEFCHCGEVVYIHDEPPGFTRGLCAHCDAARCDAYPGDCGRRDAPPKTGGGASPRGADEANPPASSASAPPPSSDCGDPLCVDCREER